MKKAMFFAFLILSFMRHKALDLFGNFLFSYLFCQKRRYIRVYEHFIDKQVLSGTWDLSNLGVDFFGRHDKLSLYCSALVAEFSPRFS